MYLNDCQLTVCPGEERESGHVVMQHGTQYTLQLRNHTGRRCDTEVTIDGKHVGSWRLNPNQLLNLERPADDKGRFTFYKSGTPEAAAAQVPTGDQAGLISVKFMPERRQPVPTVSEEKISGIGMTKSSRGFSAGGTGLSGQSSQEFNTVAPLIYDDPSTFVTINLRLVARDNGPRPLVAAGQSTPIPRSVA